MIASGPLFVAPKPLRNFSLHGMRHRRPVGGFFSAAAAIASFDASCSDMDGGESDWPAAKMSESEEGGVSSEVGRSMKRRGSQGVSEAYVTRDSKAPATPGEDAGEGGPGRAAKRVRCCWRPDDAAVLTQPIPALEASKRQLRPRFAPPEETMMNDGALSPTVGRSAAKPARRPQNRRKARKGPTPRDFDRLKGDHKKLHARYTLLKAKYSKLKGMHALATSQNRELRKEARGPGGRRERGSHSHGAEQEGERRRLECFSSGGVDAEELKQRLVCTQLQQFELSS